MGEVNESNNQTERRADTLAVSGQAAKIVVTVVSAGLIALGGLIFRVSGSVADLAGELRHMNQIEQIRHEAIAVQIEDIERDLASFKKPGGRFTAQDGKRHEARIRGLEVYRQQHSEWGRELTGQWRQQNTEQDRRLERLERHLGVDE